LFCDAITMEPVDQKAERILFHMNDDGTITTFVEISYVGRADQFAWILPIPHVIDADDVATADSSMFDTLEAMTAPQLSFFNSNAASRGNGLGCSSDSALGFRDSANDVDVVDQFSVGPFALQILRGGSAESLQTWLADNGYDLPDSAEAPLQHYIDGGMAFMGVKLIPEEVDEGPIDTLAFTYTSGAPMIPLLLTGIAAVPDMPILTYVVADGPMTPGNGYGSVDFEWDDVRTDPTGQFPTTFVPMLQDAIDDQGGHAFLLEWADSTDTVRQNLPDPNVLAGNKWIGRFRTYMDPEEMTIDPVWVRDPAGPMQIDRTRLIDTADTSRSALVGVGFLPLLFAAGWYRRRRNQRDGQLISS
jgi:hypothetical protein